MLIRTSVALLAGVVLALAFEPVGLAFLVPFAVAAFVLCVRGLPARLAWIPGLAFGAGFMYVLLFWLRVVGVDAWLALSALQAVYFAVLGSCVAVLVRLPAWPVWTACAWVAAEGIRGSWPFGGLPWGRLAFASIDTPFAAALPWVGSNGVSLLLALLGATLAWAAVHLRGRLHVVTPVLLGVAMLSMGSALVPYTAPDDTTMTVAVVQGNVPGPGDDILFDHRQVTQNHVQSTIDLARDIDGGRQKRPAFVVWPENSTAVDPFLDTEVNAGIEQASAAIDIPILVGAIVDGTSDGEVLNQGVVWNPGTGGGDRYTKRHPVAFGEYIPYRNGWLTRGVERLDLIPRDMSAGTREGPLRIAGTEVAGAICFDVTYDDGIYSQIRGGGQLLVVQTSNAMFINTSQIDQQFAVSRLRAIETGRYVLVAAVNGVSGIVAPDGEVVERAGAREQAVLVQDVGLTARTTPAVHVGPWIGRGAVAITLLALLAGLVAYARAGSGRARAARTESTEPTVVVHGSTGVV